jgi:pimeloyl-ACP methyl ester carboxylesterase
MLVVLAVAGLAPAATVTLDAGSGVKLSAEVAGTGTQGVVLVHDAGKDRSEWGGLAAKLSTAGFHVVSVDLRGHGASGGVAPATDADWLGVTADIDAAVAWLAKQGATDLHVVGSATGANLALNAAAANPAVDDLVLLSPALNSHGVKVSSAIAAYGKRPLLLVASSPDPVSVKAATWLADQAQGPKLLQVYDVSGSGARLLNTAPELEGLLVTWLHGTLLLATDPEAARDLGLKVNEVGEIETTGQRLEDRKR